MQPRAQVKLTVQVLGDDAIAAGIKLLRGEWEARSGGMLEVEGLPLAAAGDAEALTADVIVFPSRLMGTLAERGDLQPVRASVLANRELALGDIFPAIRVHEMQYGGATLALPLGAPPLLVGSSGARESDIANTLWPLAGADAAHALLLRAVGYVEHNSRADFLFNAADMKPRLSEPPFERALDEIVAEMQSHRDEPLLDMAQTLAAVERLSGIAALGWPGLVRPSVDAKTIRQTEFDRPSAAENVYSITQGKWQTQLIREPVTYLGVEGRLVGVNSRTSNAVSAFKLCQWLTTGDTAVRISSRSRATMWFRGSQLGRCGEWTGLPRGEGAEAVRNASAALASEAAFMIPRLPGIDDYLAALGDAVRTAAAGRHTAAAALKSAASAWDELTDHRGRDAQLQSYRRHLGVEPFAPR